MDAEKRRNQRNKFFLQTEVLPVEIPILFSNSPLYTEIDEILENYSDKINKKIFDTYTTPLFFTIPKKDDSLRKIALVHPLSQMTMLFFTLKYDQMIVNLTSQSEFSSRVPVKLNKTTVRNDEVNMMKLKRIEEEYGLTSELSITEEDIDFSFRGYYSYSPGKKLTSLMKSNHFRRNKNKFRYFLKLDIQNFFPSIYTHSLTWAILGSKELGKSMIGTNYSGLFSSATDLVCQKSNNNETNGIIVGPEFSRIIAEILLARVDIELQNVLSEEKLIIKKDYVIHRYIDDYYIFSDDYNSLEMIEHHLSSILQNYNLIINSGKKEIQTSPFHLYDDIVIDLKNILETQSRKRFELWMSLKENDIHKDLRLKEVLGSEYHWENTYEEIERLVRNNRNNKRKIVLYFLKSVKVEMPKISISKNSPQYKIILKIIEIISSVFSLHIDNDTTNAFLILMTKINNSVNKLKESNEVSQGQLETVENIQEKIFYQIYRLIRNNLDKLKNMCDLIVFLKFFKKKLSSQFLCEIIKTYYDSYFVLCSVAYYIERDGMVFNNYKIVIEKLKLAVKDYIVNYNSVGANNRILDANYFYMVNDFSKYQPFGVLANEFKSQMDRDIASLKDWVKLVILEISKTSYYQWDTDKTNFEKKLIKKIVINDFSGKEIESEY